MGARELSLALITALACALPATAQDEPDVRTRCVKCKHVGKLVCPEHDADDCRLETNAGYCSFMDGCGACSGLGWIDCAHCDNEEVQAELAKAIAKRPKLAKLCEEYPVGMKRDLMMGVSDHFVVVWEVEVLKVNKRRLDQHQLLHLHIDRFEQLYRDYKEFFAAEDSDFKQRVVVMVWGMLVDQRRASLVFCQNGSDRGVKLLGSTPRYSTSGNRSQFKDDETLHRSLVHNVAHVVLSHHRPSYWIGQLKAGWADAGVAHWFEDRYFGKCTNYCYQEVNSNRDFKGGKWRPVVRKMALSKESFLPDLFEQKTQTLNLPQHAIAFSLVDYLQQRDKKKLRDLLRLLRKKKTNRDALQATFGINVLQLEREWKAWVIETYPPR